MYAILEKKKSPFLRKSNRNRREHGPLLRTSLYSIYVLHKSTTDIETSAQSPPLLARLFTAATPQKRTRNRKSYRPRNLEKNYGQRQ